METDKLNTSSDEVAVYTCEEAVEHTGHGCYNYLLLAACSVTSFAVAMDMFGFSVVVAAASCDLSLTIPITGLLNSVPLAGIFFAFPWGYYADTRGRRRALLLSTAVGFVFSALSSFSMSWQVMLVLKFIGCVFSTASYTLVMTYLGENVGNARRNRYLFLMNSMNLGAELVFYLLAYLILPLDFLIPVPWLGITFRPWRLYSLGIAAPLGIGMLMLLLLEESPTLLASRGKTEQALKVLAKMYEKNGGKKDEYPVKQLTLDGADDVGTVSFCSSIVQQTVPLFKPPLLWRTLQLFYLAALCGSTNNVFLMWYPMIANSFFSSHTAGEVDNRSFCERVVPNITTTTSLSEDKLCDDTISPNTMYAGMMLGLTFATINLAAAAVAAYKRLVLMAAFLTSGVCLVTVDLLRQPLAIMVAFTLVQITVIGVSSISSYFVDLYPAAYRGLIASLAVMVSRSTALAGVNLVGAILENHCSITFFCWSVYVASGIVVSLFLPSDFKRKRTV